MPVERFKDKGAYDRWNAYTHIHGIRTHVDEAIIAGKPHKVKHSPRSKRQGQVPLSSLLGSQSKK